MQMVLASAALIVLALLWLRSVNTAEDSNQPEGQSGEDLVTSLLRFLTDSTRSLGTS
jgi:hypothetical protein